MKTYLINYAHNICYHSQKYNSYMGRMQGRFDIIIPYGFQDIDDDFKEKNEHILSQQRGAGYWLWKPYLICKTLDQMKDGDWLMYADSGSWFIHSMKHLIEPCRALNGLMLFHNDPWNINSHWTKRDCFVKMDGDTEEITAKRQLEASFVFCQKNDFVVHFMREWLRWCQTDEIVTDAANVCGEENYPGFCDHRHDQSILSILACQLKVEAIEPIYKGYGAQGHPLGIPQIIHHSRIRD